MSARVRVRDVAAVAAAGAAITAAAALAGAAPSHAAVSRETTAAVGPSAPGRGCSAALSDGRLVVSRQTGWIGESAERRYWTAVHLATTGDAVVLVTDRGIGANPITGLIVRVQRGATGIVDVPISWGFSSRSGAVVVHVSGVDQDTGKIVRVSC